MVGSDQPGAGAGHGATPPGTRPPPTRTPLVGRADLVELVTASLSSPDQRLVTLAGLGGIGKTRLALAVGATLPLASVFVDAAARVPRLDPVPGRGVGTGPLMVLLDDVPAGRPAALEVGRLLDAHPEVVVLATCLVPLRVRGEHVVRVGPMALGDGCASEAAALFRQAAVRAGAPVGGEWDDDIAALCRRLGGHPVALELAAARMATVSPADLLRLLEACNPLGLLHRGPIDVPERHRSVRAALARSYAALHPTEREVLVALAGEEAPDTLPGGPVRHRRDPLGAIAHLDALSGLVDAGFVAPEGPHGGYAVPALVRDLIRELPTRVDTVTGSGSTATVDLRTPRLLTARETQVLARLAAGEANKEIARRLGISPKTVMHHSVAIYRKLAVSGRAEAIDRAHRLGLLPLDVRVVAPDGRAVK